MDTMSDSTGALQEAQEKYIDSIQGRISQFTATFQELSTTIVNSDLIKLLLQGGTGIVSGINSILNLGNGIIGQSVLVISGIVGITKAFEVMKGSFMTGTGRHKMICLINMPVNNPMVTWNELIA